jgi:hypothetical protein
MTRFIFIATLLLSVFAFNGCEEDRWGWDNKVVFSAAGGEEDVDGDDAIHTLSIGDGRGDEKGAVEIGGIMTVKYDWLTATTVKGSDEISLIAQPNKTGERRKLYVFGMVGNRTMDITVVQNK